MAVISDQEARPDCCCYHCKLRFCCCALEKHSNPTFSELC